MITPARKGTEAAPDEQPRPRRRWTILLAAALAPVLFLGGGALFLRQSGDDPVADAPAQAVSAEQLDAGANPAGSIEALQDRLRRLPGDDQGWAALGFAYISQARRSADPSYYDLAGQALDRSLVERPEANADALAGQAALANARHEFAQGEALAQQAVAADAYDSTARGVLADSQLELGQYDAALDTLDEMARLRPGVPSFTRVSYSYELRGDIPNAEAVLQRALDISSTPADASFSLFHLGELAFNSGDLDTAAERFAEGLRRDPSQVTLLAGRAKVEAARGDTEAALTDYAEVVQRLPQPSYLVEYGELLDSLGRTQEAAQQYAVADAAQALFTAAGSVSDIEVVLYDADHGREADALTLAQAQSETRSSVGVEDAMAWALHVNGRDAEALEYALQAQRIGTRNALWDYHRGMIQLAVGQTEEGRASLQQALDTNPYFSVLHAPLAREALAASESG